MKYSDMTIEEVENIQKYIQYEVICNGDKQEIIFNNIMNEFINNFKEGLLNIFKKVYEVAETIGNTIVEIMSTIKEHIIKLLDKKWIGYNNLDKKDKDML